MMMMRPVPMVGFSTLLTLLSSFVQRWITLSAEAADVPLWNVTLTVPMPH